jgi:hypothetical protein
MNPSLAVAVALLAGLLSPPSTAAQTQVGNVRVRAVEVDGTPVRGALVALLSADGNPVAEGMTDDTGFRSLSASRGEYRVRVRRIGYQPFVSPPISVPYDGELKIAIASSRIALETVVVTAGSQCRQRGQDERAIGVLWEEISKALVGAQLTRSDFANLGRARIYRKQVLHTGRVVSLDTSSRQLSDSRPFIASDSRTLTTYGWVRGDLVSGWEYFAPDEAVLLSTAFAESHCFRVIRDKKRPQQVGVSFEPAPGRRMSDITGAVWLDEKSAELREIVFRFVNIGEIQQFKPGGRVHFRRMPSGAWLVDDWSLRFPLLELTQNLVQRLVEVGYVENGGTLIESSMPPTS